MKDNVQEIIPRVVNPPFHLTDLQISIPSDLLILATEYCLKYKIELDAYIAESLLIDICHRQMNTQRVDYNHISLENISEKKEILQTLISRYGLMIEF